MTASTLISVLPEPRIVSKLRRSGGMASEDLIDKQFTDRFNELHDLFTADRLDECEKGAFALLADPAIPRYHRMKTLILLGTIVGDWHEANQYHGGAEAIWRIVRRHHPVGSNKQADACLAELRESLDDLDVALRDEEASEYEFLDTVEEAIEKHDADVEDARAGMDDLELDNTPAVLLPNKVGPHSPRGRATATDQEGIQFLTLALCTL